MTYYLRESLFSIRNRFVVKDKFSRDAFLVKGRLFSFKKKLDLYDLRGNDRIKISERLFSFLPKYDIYLNGRKYGQVNKSLSFFRPKLRINSKMGNLNISGDIFAHNFSISLRGRTIARVSKSYLSLSDSYKLEIYDEVNHAFVVALVIVLDQIYHDSNNSQSSSNQNQDIN